LVSQLLHAEAPGGGRQAPGRVRLSTWKKVLRLAGDAGGSERMVVEIRGVVAALVLYRIVLAVTFADNIS
jgi:hypothetical protein